MQLEPNSLARCAHHVIEILIYEQGIGRRSGPRNSVDHSCATTRLATRLRHAVGAIWMHLQRLRCRPRRLYQRWPVIGPAHDPTLPHQMQGGSALRGAGTSCRRQVNIPGPRACPVLLGSLQTPRSCEGSNSGRDQAQFGLVGCNGYIR